MNEKFFELKKGHIGIVEKAQHPIHFVDACVYRCFQFRSLVAITYIAYEGEGRDGYRDQIVTCDVGVSLHSKTHPLFMK